MSLDYWRNEDKTCTLSLLDKAGGGFQDHYYLVGEWDNDITQCKLTRKDMILLKYSLEECLKDYKVK